MALKEIKTLLCIWILDKEMMSTMNMDVRGLALTVVFDLDSASFYAFIMCQREGELDIPTQCSLPVSIAAL